MNDHDREEAAFRNAFRTQAPQAPTGDVVLRPRRRWLPAVVVAAAVLAVVAGTTVLLEDDAGKSPTAAADSPTGQEREWRWVGIQDVEVRVPAGWDAALEVTRADCLEAGTDDPPDLSLMPADLRRPYVVIGSVFQVSTLQGCGRRTTDHDPDPAFGEVPFPLWQPYVKVETAWKSPEDTDEVPPTSQDTVKTFRGWKLTRATEDGVQISVLSAPGDDDLAAQVLASRRTVTTTVDGCTPTVTTPSDKRTAPDGAPWPAADSIGAVAICDYLSEGKTGGLNGSRLLTGEAARELITAIQDAPRGTGPDHPENCLPEYSHGRWLVLRPFASQDDLTGSLGDAQVFFDGCAGNGIVGPAGVRELTRGNCQPLFARPPVSLMSGDGAVFNRCFAG